MPQTFVSQADQVNFALVGLFDDSLAGVRLMPSMSAIPSSVAANCRVNKHSGKLLANSSALK
ncbi:hypothetical protein MRX60_12820 (plasmid) [Xylella fastidiosa subsp. pauca]|nr:hypothetical protein [Xylella fastidiosa subsp. pauca]MDG5826914.1 hypothetical protein [Xylella fastidiosa subsp. pauca]